MQKVFMYVVPVIKSNKNEESKLEDINNNYKIDFNTIDNCVRHI